MKYQIPSYFCLGFKVPTDPCEPDIVSKVATKPELNFTNPIRLYFVIP